MHNRWTSSLPQITLLSFTALSLLSPFTTTSIHWSYIFLWSSAFQICIYLFIFLAFFFLFLLALLFSMMVCLVFPLWESSVLKVNPKCSISLNEFTSLHYIADSGQCPFHKKERTRYKHLNTKILTCILEQGQTLNSCITQVSSLSWDHIINMLKTLSNIATFPISRLTCQQLFHF